LEIIPIAQKMMNLGRGELIPAFSMGGLENMGYCLRAGHFHYSRKRYDYYRANPGTPKGLDERVFYEPGARLNIPFTSQMSKSPKTDHKIRRH